MTKLFLVLAAICCAVAVSRPAYVQLRFVSAEPANADGSQWHLDFYMSCFFQESSLTLISHADGDDISTYAASSIPRFEYLNSRDASISYQTMTFYSTTPSFLAHPSPTVTVGQPWIYYDSRVRGTFDASGNEGADREFPYDKRRISVVLESANQNLANLNFVVNPSGNNIRAGLGPRVGSFSVKSQEMGAVDFYYDYYDDDFSRATFVVEAERDQYRAILYVAIGLFLLYVANLCTFAVAAGSSARLSIAVVTYIGVIIFTVVSTGASSTQFVSKLDRYHLLIALLLTLNSVYHAIVHAVLRACGKANTDKTSVVPVATGDSSNEEASAGVAALVTKVDAVLYLCNVVVFIVAAATILKTAPA